MPQVAAVLPTDKKSDKDPGADFENTVTLRKPCAVNRIGAV